MVGGAADEAHHRQRRIAPLLFEAVEVDRSGVDARRRAGLQPVDAQRQLTQALRQCDRRRIAGAAASVVVEADVDLAAEEGAGAQHHRFGAKADAALGDDADGAIALDDQIVDRLLEDLQVGLVFQNGTDRRLVQHAVGLRAGGAHRRPFAAVEDAELDAAAIGRPRHRAAERVDLLDQMAFADAADSWVARHLAQRLDVVAQQQRAAAHPRRSQTGLGAGVAAANDDDIETIRVVHGVFSSRGVCKTGADYTAALSVREWN